MPKLTPEELEARRAKRRAEREAHTQYDNDRQVLTFDQWCRLNNISGSTGKRILASGDGPTLLRLSERRIGIRLSDHLKWTERLAKARKRSAS